MTSLLDEVRKRIPHRCITTRCKRKRCSVNLKNVPTPHIIVDMDKAELNHKARKCDYIYIEETDNAWVVALELKSGMAEASEIVEQLQASALFAEQTIPKNFQVRFRPVLVSRGIKKAQREELRNKANTIKFRKKDFFVHRIKCGGHLISVLKNTADPPLIN